MSKGVIWASEYSLGPQIWGPGGGPGPRGPPRSATAEGPVFENVLDIGLLWSNACWAGLSTDDDVDDNADANINTWLHKLFGIYAKWTKN